MKNDDIFGSGISELLKGVATPLSELTQFSESHQSLMKALGSSSTLSALESAWAQPTPNKAVLSVLSGIGNGLEITSTPAVKSALGVSKLLTDVSVGIKNTYPTSAISALEKSVISGAFASGLTTFASELNKPVVETQNLALVKLNPSIQQALHKNWGPGTASVVKQMHVGTACKLARTDKISYRKSDKKFFVEDSVADTATIIEMNVVCAAIDFFPDIPENELMKFLSLLANEPTFASADPIGKKIYELIASLTPTRKFDCELYYHARQLKTNAAPYPNDEMGKAPSGLTAHGRFNWQGKSHYYFSDQEKGALLETKKHSTKPCKIQIASIAPQKEIKMIDLSGDFKGNSFLEYCRFPMSSGEHTLRERAYLLPCFVGDCCRRQKLDGIKYYGSQEYSNYVTWSDGHFSVVSSKPPILIE